MFNITNKVPQKRKKERKRGLFFKYIYFARYLQYDLQALGLTAEIKYMLPFSPDRKVEKMLAYQGKCAKFI